MCAVPGDPHALGMTRTTEPAARDIAGLRRAGTCLLVASGLWWVAAATLIPPEDYFFADSAREEALAIVAHPGMFRAFHVVATAGIAAGVVGLALLARWLRSRTATVAAAVAGAAFVAWLVEAGVRVTAGVSRARDFASGLTGPESEPAVGSWPVFAAAAVGFAMPAVVAWVLARERVPGRRSSLLAAVFLTLGTVAAAATLAPSVVYQFGLLPFALVLVLARRRQRALAPILGSVTACGEATTKTRGRVDNRRSWCRHGGITIQEVAP